MNNNGITSLATPLYPYDAANKYYVDSKTYGNLSGNVTQGQVLVGNSGGSIISFTSMTFNQGLLSLYSTQNSIGLGSGGTLDIYGGASILGNLYTSGIDNNDKLIANVASPVNQSDAVNKGYVDYFVDYFIDINNRDISENTFILSNNINTPTDITNFLFNNSIISSFEALVYLQIPELNIYDQWNINGILKGNSWVIVKTFIGDRKSKVSFSITNSGQMQYTNKNLIGTATIRFRATMTSQGLYNNNTSFGNIFIRDVPSGGTGNTFFTNGCLLYGNGSLAISTDSTFLFTSGSLLVGPILINGNSQNITNVTSPNLDLDVANKWYVDQMVGSGGSGGSGGSLLLNGSLSINDTTDATSATSGGAFTDFGGAGIAKKLYVGTELFVNNINITPSSGDIIYEQSFNAANNIVSPTNITNFVFSNSIVRYFRADVSVNIVTNTGGLASGHELKGIQLSDGTWQLNTSSIGDITNIVFTILAGQLQYTSSNTSGWISTTINFKSTTTSN
jgi:hypothetical protein